MMSHVGTTSVSPEQFGVGGLSTLFLVGVAGIVLASFCRESQNSTLESWFLAFFRCRFCLLLSCAV
jgi:hypothetical protein